MGVAAADGTCADRSSEKVPEGHQGYPVLDDLAAARWVQDYNAAWLGQDWDSLAAHMAPGVEFVVPGLAEVLIGRAAVIGNLRNALSRMVIHEYNATDLTGHGRSPVGIILYRWQLDYSIGLQHFATSGRDVLVLSEAEGRRLLVWRGQFGA